MNRLLLTGTPLQNNLSELWSLLNFLLPEVFNDLPLFESWFDPRTIQNNGGTEKILKQEGEKHILASLREILKPFMLRRVKSDVCLDIPPKKEIIMYAPVTQLQHDLYKAVINHDLDMLFKLKEKPTFDWESGTRLKRQCVLRKYNTSSQSLDATHTASSEETNLISSNDKLSVWTKYTDVTERNRDFFVNLKFGNRGKLR